MSPADGVKYGIEYDRFGRASEFSLNGNKLLSKEYDYENNSVTAKYYKTDSTYTAIVYGSACSRQTAAACSILPPRCKIA